MQQGWEKLQETNGNDLIRKFIKATYERCPLEDQSQFIRTFDDIEPYNKSRNFEELLAHAPDMYVLTEKGTENTIISTVKTYIESIIRKCEDDQVSFIVSLSGGVDSMVCLHCLKHLQPMYGYHLDAVHINYSNRISSDAEEKFVASWAKLLDVRLFSRRIHEIRRTPCMNHDLRNTYESYTRNVRYCTYKTVNKAAYVVLGHNKDDCLENIFQNISHHSKYDDLRGMANLSVQDGITFFRPLLEITKDDIIDFAKSHGIPFLPNSTPAWSQRGQIRNKIVPVLNDWNRDMIPGLHDLATMVSDMHRLSMMYIRSKTDLFAAVAGSGNRFKALFNKEDPCLFVEMFWRSVLQRVIADEVISKRSLQSFLHRLHQTSSTTHTNKPKHIRFNLNKNVQVMCTDKDECMIIELIYAEHT